MEYLIDISTESYCTQDKYSLSNMAKSLVACGVLAASLSGGSAIATTLPSRNYSLNTLATKTGSDEIHISRLYESYNATWSNVSISPSQLHDNQVNISDSLNIIKMLSFIEGDNEAENRADNFFNSKQISTKKVLLRREK